MGQLNLFIHLEGHILSEWPNDFFVAQPDTEAK